MPKGRTANPRRWNRQPASIPVSLVLKPEDFKTDDSATALDISLRGARVRTKLALVPGEWVGVVAKNKFPNAIPTRVVWAQEDESSHFVFAGLEFLSALES
jgi:hypothetical protein